MRLALSESAGTPVGGAERKWKLGNCVLVVCSGPARGQRTRMQEITKVDEGRELLCELRRNFPLAWNGSREPNERIRE